MSKLLILTALVALSCGCTSIKYPIQMRGDKVAYATYKYSFYDKEAEVIIRPDGTIEFRKQDRSRGDAAIEAAVRAAINAASGGE